MRSALDELVGSGTILLKWPNDLLLRDGRKVAGVLCERVHKADLIGVGVNVNVPRSRFPRALRARCGSLMERNSRPLPLNDVVARLARHLHLRLTQHTEHHFGQLLREYDQHHALLGRQVEVTSSMDSEPLAGVCLGLDRMGRLLLRDARNKSRIHRIIAGHVEST